MFNAAGGCFYLIGVVMVCLDVMRSGGAPTGAQSTMSTSAASRCLCLWSPPRGAATRPCPSTARPDPTWRTCGSCALMSTRGITPESWLHGALPASFPLPANALPWLACTRFSSFGWEMSTLRGASGSPPGNAFVHQVHCLHKLWQVVCYKACLTQCFPLLNLLDLNAKRVWSQQFS